MNFLRLTISSIAAGIAISISCIAFLASGNPWTFPIGLFIVCFFGFHLFTGRVCYAKPKDISNLIWMWLMNVFAAAGIGIVTHFMRPDLAQKALELVATKLNEGGWIIPRAILCNVMIFIAVHAWKNLPSPNNAIGLIFATAIFVICGFEHCIANAFYFGCAYISGRVGSFLILNTIGNILGGLAAYHCSNFIKTG